MASSPVSAGSQAPPGARNSRPSGAGGRASSRRWCRSASRPSAARHACRRLRCKTATWCSWSRGGRRACRERSDCAGSPAGARGRAPDAGTRGRSARAGAARAREERGAGKARHDAGSDGGEPGAGPVLRDGPAHPFPLGRSVFRPPRRRPRRRGGDARGARGGRAPRHRRQPRGPTALPWGERRRRGRAGGCGPRRGTQPHAARAAGAARDGARAHREARPAGRRGRAPPGRAALSAMGEA
jgi:hypothetical protein